jgi:hypothetical protein
MQRLIEGGHLTTNPVSRQHVLYEVVGAHIQEVKAATTPKIIGGADSL